MNKIAIVDDEKNFAKLLGANLESEGFSVDLFYNGNDFEKHILTSSPDVVLLDINLPDNHGLNIFNTILKYSPLSQVIVITAHGDVETSLHAIEMGCFDYINKPFSFDEIIIIIKRALEKRKLLEELEFRRKNEYQRFDLNSFVGSSKISNNLKEMIKTVSLAEDVTVLIQGESGSGKNLVARIIHNLSIRCDKPFIEVNCASIPESLFESELFGYEKGAFTDAKVSKRGLIELAHTGTLFLDEIAELPIETQAKFLSFLESKKFRKVGGTNEIQVDIRVVASTNRNLQELVKDKKFREDLYYRLNVINVNVPPLRERKEDIVKIAEYFLSKYNKKYHKQLSFSESLIKKIHMYNWPGNVRELKNVIERAVVLNTSSEISEERFPICEQYGDSGSIDNDTIDSVEKKMIIKALEESNGVKVNAAERLGISRYTLLRKMKKYNIT